MAEVGGRVGIGRTAAAAVLGVEGVLDLAQRVRMVLDPEEDDIVRRSPPASEPRSATSGSSAFSTYVVPAGRSPINRAQLSASRSSSP